MQNKIFRTKLCCNYTVINLNFQFMCFRNAFPPSLDIVKWQVPDCYAYNHCFENSAETINSAKIKSFSLSVLPYLLIPKQ